MSKSDINENIVNSLQIKLRKKEEKIRILEEKVNYLDKLCLEKHYPITQMSRKSSKQSNDCEEPEKRDNYPNNEIKAEDISTFVESQNERPIIRNAAIEFKQIQR